MTLLKRLWIAPLIVLAAGLFFLLRRPNSGDTPPASPTPTLAAERSFDVRGRVRAVEGSGRTLTVEHEAIPGFMPAMTMPFEVKNPMQTRGLEPGEAVGFRFVVGADSSWITDIERLDDRAGVPIHPAAAEGPGLQAPKAMVTRVKEGDPVPSFTLTDQAGRVVRLADLRGKAVLMTFIYTRCPVPTFCPRMSANFKALQTRLVPVFGDRVQLLSITIDPAHDTPEVFRAYAIRQGADPDRWRFLTGSPETLSTVAATFGLFSEPELNGTLNHSLVTALIGPDGRLVQLWRGNAWTPDEVARRTAALLG